MGTQHAAPSPFVEAVLRLSAYALPDLHFFLRKELRGCATVLDVGSGADFSPFRFVPRYSGQRRIAVDAFEPSIQRSRALGIYDGYVSADIRAFANDPANKKRFDCVVALDVIEHFEKTESVRLVDDLESLARRKVVLFTPNGFLPQEPYDGNASQRHLCGWSAQELRERGYHVWGAYGLKPLRGEYSQPVMRPKLLGQAVAMLSQTIVWNLPSLAFSLFAVKNLRAPYSSREVRKRSAL